MTDDAHLLRQYVQTGAESAFAELVQRHLPLVYHAAARQLGLDDHLAADVSQGVFLLLAAKARSLVTHANLSGWLYATTRFKVAETLRTERRRRAREAAVLLMTENNQDPTNPADWGQVRPVLDEALLELSATDREAVLLRFFEQRPFVEIASRLRVTDATAHKRVERALDKLREHLARRGLTSTAAALATLLSGHAAGAVPSGLAASVTTAVVTSGLSATAVGAFSFMSTKIAVVTAAAVTLVVSGVVVREVNAERMLAASLHAQEAENAGWRSRFKAQPVRTAAVAPVMPAAPSPRPAAEPAATQPATQAGGLASVEESRAFLRANPDVREAFSNYLRLTLEYRYADLIAALQLDATRKERFLELLTLARRQILGEHQLTLAERDFEPGELGRELRAVLGEAGFQSYQEFDRKNLTRAVNYELTKALYATPTPLTTAQADAIERIVSGVTNDPSFGPRFTGSSWTSLPLERWDRIVAEAARVLPEPQVEAVREMAQRTRFWHAQAEARRAYDRQQKANTPPR
ncbi:MAG: sigma-70 family RNA polymerase sigma factor [Opitutaceae bacterium]